MLGFRIKNISNSQGELDLVVTLEVFPAGGCCRKPLAHAL